MINISVCIGSSCHLKGSYNVIQTFQQLIEENRLHDKVTFKATFCIKQCYQSGITVTVDDEKYSITSEGAREFFRDKIITKICA
jgi:NADH:ubiquinone oxidoreductase subunit E